MLWTIKWFTSELTPCCNSHPWPGPFGLVLYLCACLPACGTQKRLEQLHIHWPRNTQPTGTKTTSIYWLLWSSSAESTSSALCPQLFKWVVYRRWQCNTIPRQEPASWDPEKLVHNTFYHTLYPLKQLGLVSELWRFSRSKHCTYPIYVHFLGETMLSDWTELPGCAGVLGPNWNGRCREASSCQCTHRSGQPVFCFDFRIVCPVFSNAPILTACGFLITLMNI